MTWLVWPCVYAYDDGNGEYQAAVAAVGVAEDEFDVDDAEVEVDDVELVFAVADYNDGDGIGDDNS